MEPSRKRKRNLMPNLPNNEPDESQDFDELNQLLNSQQEPIVISDDEDVEYLGSRNSQINVTYDQNGVPLLFDYYPPKWRRKEEPLKLNIPHPWNYSSGLPYLEPVPDSAQADKVIAEQKCSVPPTSSEEDSSYARRCYNISTTPGSSDSDITKEDVKDNSPLVSKKPEPVVHVSSFRDLMAPTKRNIQTEERPLMNNEKPEDIVEPMKCDEGIKSEVNADTMSLQKRNKRGVSLVEHFTEEEIKLHIMSLEKPSGQNAIRETCDLEDEEEEEEACQLCNDGRLSFPPPPIYCSSCNCRISDEGVYYTPGEELSDAQYLFCSPCHTHCRSNFKLSEITISKANMIKWNNADNQIIEEWVQCGSCEKWQHQICGLYNKHKDEDKTAEYICPLCLLEERKSNNNNIPFVDNKDLGAKDLPETILSYFIEQRLFRRLNEERCQTGKAKGKNIDDVPEPEGLTLRVVYSADKTSTVNKQFADFFRKENYPSEFPYRSKVILLFQKVEGVDICIFALMVQEFGSECSQPNQRSTYIFYLDSVKYFRPQRLTFSGEALRTFVYHEILIGYLEYCKLQGFTTSYIWACPPEKGEDYIMNSHPKTQQTPNAKKLLKWYESMLEKAVEQRVVTNVTNLYHRFFVPTEESTCNMTAARLPYFEGSFWSCNTENLIQEIEKEGNKELQKMVRSLSRRKLKSMSYKSTGCVDVDDAKNILLMQQLEEKVYPKKEEFLVVDLHYSCTRCSKAILSGWRWFCGKCKNLQLCESCYDAEQELPGEHIHKKNNEEKHQLSQVQVNGILSTTEDHAIIQESNIFESRQAFLAFSQKHNYNFDTLRRAKHSSMMILYHLHTSNKHLGSQNSSRLTCTVCKKDVSTTIYFPCLLCPDYRACNGCYTKDTILRHLHLFPTLPSANGAPPKTVMVLGILKALSHALLCRPTDTKLCSYPKCKEVKALFSHSEQCKIREKRYCMTCCRVRQIIRIHAHHCQDLVHCPVPHCRDYKEVLFRKV